MYVLELVVTGQLAGALREQLPGGLRLALMAVRYEGLCRQVWEPVFTHVLTWMGVQYVCT